VDFLMAAGDPLGVIGAAGAVLSYQPAATTAFIITWSATSDSYDTLALTDGALVAYQYNKGGDTQNINQSSIKMIIDNTNYLTVAGGTLPGARSTGITGIQIQ